MHATDPINTGVNTLSVAEEPGKQQLAVQSQGPRNRWGSDIAKAQEKVNIMQFMGIHVFNPNWNDDGIEVKDKDVVKFSTYHSATFTECVMTIFGTGETITLPVQTCTKVIDVKNAVAAQAMVDPGQITFVKKSGCSFRIQHDHDEVAKKVTIKGIESFNPQPYKYPHPTVFIGAGYNGIKHMLLWAHHGARDWVCYDRYDRCGGHAWLVQANKTSKLQTELAAFHVWFGQEWDDKNTKLSYPVEWSTWPKQDECIRHMQHAAEVYGLIPHVKFEHNVDNFEIVGKPNDLDRYYLTHITDKRTGETTQLPFSNIYHFPGAYFNPRIIDYPGEDEFDGHVGYGMNNDIPFEHLKNSRTAILGNGAFAIENIRTCVEHGAEKVYLITRKKNLPCPRIVCWFAHQAIVPVPASMMLNFMDKFFQQTGFGDPWSYHSVYGSKDKNQCTIKSASRFGIGDVTFLAVATGRCEYHQDLLKRCSYHCLHLEKGTKLEGVTNIIKCLGLIADWEADRFHKIKELVGTWPNGDYRRFVFADPLGMDAANFTTLSAGIGGYNASHSQKHLVDFPMEWRRLQDMGVLDMAPRNKATEHRPAHQYDARYAQMSGMIVDGSMPRLQMKFAGLDDYMHKCYMAVNPPEKFYKECIDSWDQYQKDFKEQGYDHPYVPYPYTWEDVQNMFEEYNKTVGPISIEQKMKGWHPQEKKKKGAGEDAAGQEEAPQAAPEGEMQMQVHEQPQPEAHHYMPQDVHMDNIGAKRWWRENCSQGSWMQWSVGTGTVGSVG